jgi:hypothetical protein
VRILSPASFRLSPLTTCAVVHAAAPLESYRRCKEQKMAMQEGARTLRAGCRCALLPRVEREGVQLCRMRVDGAGELDEEC